MKVRNYCENCVNYQYRKYKTLNSGYAYCKKHNDRCLSIQKCQDWKQRDTKQKMIK